jgi:hypothetical protein
MFKVGLMHIVLVKHQKHVIVQKNVSTHKVIYK